VHSNGTRPEADAGAILTPPGAGGDVHGGLLGPGTTPPEPPA
jgi:cell division protease FtsH